MMVEYPIPNIPHKCNIWDYCFLDNEYKLLFCAICHRIVGFEKDNVRVIRKEVLNQDHNKPYTQKEYSKDILKDSI